MKKVTQEKIDYMIHNYVTSRKTTYEIAKELELTNVTVGVYLRKNGINPNRQHYKFNENYFELLDSENKAYFLGLLYADGSIHKRKNSCKLTLTEGDKHILEKMKDEVEIKKPLSYGKSGPIKDTKYIGKAKYSLELNSEKLINDLEKLGVVPNKCQVIRFPDENIVPKEFIRDFIRGWMDGDGCIFTSQKRIMLNFVSNEYFLEGFSNFLKDNLSINTKYHKDKGSNSWFLYISKSKDAIKFCEYIYADNNCTKLIRKYQKYQDYLKSEHGTKTMKT